MSWVEMRGGMSRVDKGLQPKSDHQLKGAQRDACASSAA